MKKIVFVVSTIDSGGVENYLLRFLKYFENRILPIVVCRGNHFGELEGEYRKIKNIELVKMDLARFDIKSNKEFYSFLREMNPDTFVDFSGKFSGLLLFFAKLAGIKKRIVFYRDSSYGFKITLFKLMFIYFLKVLINFSSTKILSNSIAALDYYHPKRNNKSSKFKVIYNGIDPKQLIRKNYLKEDFGIPSNAFVIGHTGRFNSAKNHNTILDVAEIICEKYENVYFVLCGKNTEISLSSRVSDNIVLKNKVKLLGYRNDVPSILTLFDLFLFPSISEGQPNSLIEAMISGLPVVASNIKTIRETTPVNLHEELVHPLDVSGFCSRISEYYLSEQKRKDNNLSTWATNYFRPEVLFNEFYEEL